MISYGCKPPASGVSSHCGVFLPCCVEQRREVALWKLPCVLPSLTLCSKIVVLPPWSGCPVAAGKERFAS